MPDSTDNSTDEPADAASEPRTREDLTVSDLEEMTKAELWQLDYEDLSPHLTYKQRQYVTRRPDYANKKEVAQAIDRHPDTVRQWPDYVHVASHLKHEAETDPVAMLLERISGKAAAKLEELIEEADDERVVLDSIRYAIDRVKGKPTRKSEVEVEGGIDLDPDDEGAIDDALSHLD